MAPPPPQKKTRKTSGLLTVATLLVVLTLRFPWLPHAFKEFCVGSLTAIGVLDHHPWSDNNVSVTQPCKRGSMNCLHTTWKYSGSSDAAVASFRQCLEEYPQDGQNDADMGGWAVTEDHLNNDNNKQRLLRAEFSSGQGPMAKLLNGGVPFIDDLVVEVEGDAIENDVATTTLLHVRSSSRKGYGDMLVNQKRLQFLSDCLLRQAEQWDASVPEYSQNFY